MMMRLLITINNSMQHNNYNTIKPELIIKPQNFMTFSYISDREQDYFKKRYIIYIPTKKYNIIKQYRATCTNISCPNKWFTFCSEQLCKTSNAFKKFSAFANCKLQSARIRLTNLSPTGRICWLWNVIYHVVWQPLN